MNQMRRIDLPDGSIRFVNTKPRSPELSLEDNPVTIWRLANKGMQKATIKNGWTITDGDLSGDDYSMYGKVKLCHEGYEDIIFNRGEYFDSPDYRDGNQLPLDTWTKASE